MPRLKGLGINIFVVFYCLLCYNSPKKWTMTKQIINIEELRPFIPDNGNKENYTLLAQYLKMKDSPQKEKNFNVLVNDYGFSGYKIAQAEKWATIKSINNCKDEKVFRLGELFCGPGGLAWGAIHAKVKGVNYKIVHEWANDFDRDTCDTYFNNICSGDKAHNNTVICEDVHTLDINKLSSIDALAFGFPCNDFSVVGEQKDIMYSVESQFSSGKRCSYQGKGREVAAPDPLGILLWGGLRGADLRRLR